jgi:ubiquinone/menaquinone biosynthesis C-methylase UbiE
VIVDIGCGPNKVKGAIGVDRLALPGVDIVCDFEVSPLPFGDSSVDEIHTRHVLEHVRDLERLLREFSRVLKPSGKLHVTVPHFSCSLAYSDPTHVRFFGLYTFDYFSRAKDRRWDVPSYTSDIWFTIKSKRFNFRNLSALGSIADRIFNRCQYIYESKLCWLIPCFELHYELQVDKAHGSTGLA